MRPTSPYDLHSLRVVFGDENTNDIDDTHFTLKRSIDPSKFTHLFRINPTLSVTNANYPLWQANTFRALRAVSLHTYLEPTFLPSPITQNRVEYICWNQANDFVCLVLTSRMESEAQTQLGHLTSAAEMWTEARCIGMTDSSSAS